MSYRGLGGSIESVLLFFSERLSLSQDGQNVNCLSHIFLNDRALCSLFDSRAFNGFISQPFVDSSPWIQETYPFSFCGWCQGSWERSALWGCSAACLGVHRGGRARSH
jgi:hypothetical protein